MSGAYGFMLAGVGGHVIIDSADGLVTSYHIRGFIPQTDTTITTLKLRSKSTVTDNVAQTTKTYTAGIYYPARLGFYEAIEISDGAVVAYKTEDSPA